MKLNASINLKIKSDNISGMLTVLLLLILFLEIWVVYSKLYQTVFIQETPDVSPNVVRVNLTQYTQTVEYIESLETYQAKDLTLPRGNIFR